MRFAGDTATIEFREPNARGAGLSADLARTGSSSRSAAGPPAPAAASASRAGRARAPAATPLTIVVDPGHGGTETGAIGPGGLQEKEATLEIAKRVAADAAARPRVPRPC